jgi:hypothetical protein
MLIYDCNSPHSDFSALFGALSLCLALTKQMTAVRNTLLFIEPHMLVSDFTRLLIKLRGNGGFQYVTVKGNEHRKKMSRTLTDRVPYKLYLLIMSSFGGVSNFSCSHSPGHNLHMCIYVLRYLFLELLVTKSFNLFGIMMFLVQVIRSKWLIYNFVVQFFL